MAALHDLDEAEMENLRYVPFAVFFIVAYADGKLTAPESNTFGMFAKNIAQAAFRPQDAITREVMADVSANLGAILARLDAEMGAGLELDAVLTRGRDILDASFESTEGSVFKNTMMVLAQRIAEAGQLFRPKISTPEHNAIEMIKVNLGIGGLGDAFVPFSR